MLEEERLAVGSSPTMRLSAPLCTNPSAALQDQASGTDALPRHLGLLRFLYPSSYAGSDQAPSTLLIPQLPSQVEPCAKLHLVISEQQGCLPVLPSACPHDWGPATHRQVPTCPLRINCLLGSLPCTSPLQALLCD